MCIYFAIFFTCSNIIIGEDKKTKIYLFLKKNLKHVVVYYF